jgi:DNA-damage-inducible protein D
VDIFSRFFPKRALTLQPNPFFMKKELIRELFEKFEQACYVYKGIECWSARERQVILGYSKWTNFQNVVQKAKDSCANAGLSIPDHFTDIGKMIELAKGAQRTVEDIALTRYACYLIAQNGDPLKDEIAFAQTYFAVQARKQELVEQLSTSGQKLSGIIFERGVDDKGFSIIRSKGDQALFGGHPTHEMKKRLSVPDRKPLADYLPTLIRRKRKKRNKFQPT